MGRWLITLAFALLPALARADEREWRAGVGGGGTVVSARAGGADGTGLGFGARARLGYGLSDTIELSMVAAYLRASDIAFSAATLGGQTGNLFADVSTFTVGAELRWTPGVGFARAFERTGPYLAGRAGASVVLRTSQQVFTASSLLLLDADDDLRIAPFTDGAVGVEHRFGDHFFIAAELEAFVCFEQRSVAITVEAAWAWY